MATKPLVLASSSPYRKQLLARLGVAFEAITPNIDETSRPGETAPELALRLAEAKARALAGPCPNHWIIGSDQAAALPDGKLLNKPGNHEKARLQLQQCSSHTVTFHTGLVLLDSDSNRIQRLCEPFTVSFRPLTAREIEHYLQVEKPYDCAGSFKMEALGITLFESLTGRDPNCLIGLPIIGLNDMLRHWNLDTLALAYRNSTP